jgi:hypothetical protein
LNPPDYTGKYVATNPPFLARNKSKSTDKTAFARYDTDDLYKAALQSMLKAEGGLLVVPLNFFSSKESATRKLFLDQFTILKVIAFEESVFEDTDYTVCSFAFVKHDRPRDQHVEFVFKPTNESKIFALKQAHDYQVGVEFTNLITDSGPKVTRLREDQTPNSKLFLRALDTGTVNGRIALSIAEQPFFGKNTDRTFASIQVDCKLSESAQKLLCILFNAILEQYRTHFHSMFLNGYRNSGEYARKRIAFDDAYALISHIIKHYKLETV